jgi:hypothetical protein
LGSARRDKDSAAEKKRETEKGERQICTVGVSEEERGKKRHLMLLIEERGGKE